MPSQEPDRLKNLRLVLTATIGGPWQAPASSSNAGSPALEKNEVWDGTPFSSSGVASARRHEKLKPHADANLETKPVSCCQPYPDRREHLDQPHPWWTPQAFFTLTTGLRVADGMPGQLICEATRTAVIGYHLRRGYSTLPNAASIAAAAGALEPSSMWA